MLQKHTNKFTKKAALLLVSPILLGVIGGSSIANAANLFRSASSVSSSSRGSLASSLSRLTSGGSYKLTRSEKVLGGIGMGVGLVSLVGTAVGLGLTEKQYEQAKSSYENVVDRTYYNFFEEREQEMKSLFNEWAVPMPEKYKNPLKDTNKINNEVTKGFSIGKGE